MKAKTLKRLSLLLISVLLLTACGNKQEPTATSDPAASGAPIGTTAPTTSLAAGASPAVTPTAGSITPAALTPDVTQGVDVMPGITPSEEPSPSSVPSGAATPSPDTKQPVTPNPTKGANNNTPTQGAAKGTPAPNPGHSGKKLLYAVSDVGVQDAPNYYTSGSLGKLTHGKQYEVLETIKGTTMTWYRISFNGKNGYVETKYLLEYYCSPTPTHAYTQKELAQMVGTGVVWTEVCPEMLTLVNKARRELNLREMMWGDKELEEIALARVVDTIEELENGCVHAGTTNYYHKGLECPILEIFCWGANTCQVAFNSWKSSPGHWASIIDDGTEDEVSLFDMTWPDGHEVKEGDIIPGVDAYMVCAHAIYEGHDYWVIVYAGKRRPWPND